MQTIGCVYMYMSACEWWILILMVCVVVGSEVLFKKTVCSKMHGFEMLDTKSASKRSEV